MDLIIKRFYKMMYISMFAVLLDIFMGVILLVFPDMASKMAIVLVGSLIVIHGLFYLIRYIYDGLGSRVFSVDLITGVAAVILGLFTIFNPFNAITVIGILFGIWLLVRGLEKLYYSIIFISHHDDLAPIFIMISLLIILMGILVMINPFESFMLVTRLAGIFLICDGLFELMTCRLFQRKSKDIIKLFE